jgi:ClpP class serine protease
MGKLLRLTNKLYNTPHLMLPASLERVFTYLDDRNNHAELAVQLEKKPKERNVQYVAETQVGVLSVSGPLTYIEYEAMCGEQNSSYQQIVDDFDKLCSMGAKTIVMDVDSPGGMAYGMMETGRYLRKKANEKGIQLVAYVDGLSASAAFGLSVAAHEIIANPDAELGSVGVVVKLRNMNKAMNNAGVEDTYIYAGDSKIPFKEDGSFREDFLADIQYKVDALYQQFTEYVADMRGIDVGVVKSTQAKVLLAQDAIGIGFADKVMTREDFSNYLADLVEKPMRFSFKSKGENKNMTTDVIEQEAVASLKADFEAAVAKNAELAAALAAQNEAFEAAQAQAAELQKAVAAAQEQIAQMQAAAAKEASDKRMAALQAVVDQDQAATLHVSLAALDDKAFATVVASLQTKAVDEDKAFAEKGFAGSNADPVEEDKTAAIIKAKYAAKKQ